MKRTRKNLRYHELIGLEVMVRKHLDPGLQGLEGNVVYETKKTLHIRGRDGRVRVVPKMGGVFLFKLKDREVVELRGDLIMGRPEERMKKYRGGA